jgi:hypothetical protein
VFLRSMNMHGQISDGCLSPTRKPRPSFYVSAALRLSVPQPSGQARVRFTPLRHILPALPVRYILAPLPCRAIYPRARRQAARRVPRWRSGDALSMMPNRCGPAEPRRQPHRAAHSIPAFQGRDGRKQEGSFPFTILGEGRCLG